jgi:hypothetical protein
VIILGAGASKPFGYPVGRELKGDIVKLNDVPLHDHGFTHDQYQGFAQRLKRSNIGSVDAFIEKYPKYQDIGTAAIALALARK